MSAPAVALPYPWQREQWHEFERWIDADKMPHALLLTGSQGIGKLRLGHALAQYLLCQRPAPGGACGRCKTCQLYAAGSHPDMRLLAPEEDGKAIRIDPVRQLREFLAKTPQQGQRKIALVAPAEAMNINAFNALLKSLEEPQGNTLIILVSHNFGQLPATVRSRCHRVALPIPAAAEVFPWLQQIVGTDTGIHEVLERTAGRPLAALEYLQSDLGAVRDEFEDQLRALQRGDLHPIAAAQSFAQLDVALALDWFWYFLQQSALGAVYHNHEPVPRRQLFEFCDQVIQAKADVLSGANPNLTLLWEALLMRWRQPVVGAVNAG